MGKLRVAGNRLSIGSWSMPLGRTSSESKRKSYSSVAAPVTKEAELESTPSSNAVPLSKATTTSTSRLIELAATITRETEKLDRYIKESGAPEPSFDVDGPLNFPQLEEEVKRAREEVVRATKELGDLVTGPTESVRWMAWDVSFAHT